VNQCWLCDEGRLSYKEINSADRLLTPLQGVEERLESIAPEPIVNEIARALKTIGPDNLVVVGSAQASNENNTALRKFAKLLNPSAMLLFSRREVPHPTEDDFLIKADKNPNTKGVSHLGFTPVKGRIVPEVLIILGELSEVDRKILFAQETALTIVLSSHKAETASYADYLLPITTHAEEEGSFTNFQGRLQRFHPALKIRGQMRPAWAWFKEIAEKMGLEWGVSDAEGFLREGFGVSYKDLGSTGKIL